MKGSMKLIKPSEFYNYEPAVPVKWIVEGMLRQNRKRVSVICGSPHSGKSTLARQLALAVAHGQPFLGRATTQTKVLYWQSEETPEDAKEDFTKSGMLSSDDANLVIVQPESQDHNLKELNEVLVQDHDIGLVIIETLDDFLKIDDLGDNSSARRAFEKFDKDILEEHCKRCSFVVLHHFKKSDEQRGSSLNQMLGATVIAGKTDGKIFLRQVSDADQRHYIRFQMRKGVDIEPTYLNFDPETQASTLGVTLADEKAAAKKAKITVNAIDLRGRVLGAVMNNAGEPRRNIAKIVGGDTTTTLAKINELIANGDIVAHGNALYIKGKATPVIDCGAFEGQEVTCLN
jgi:AAA domain